MEKIKEDIESAEVLGFVKDEQEIEAEIHQLNAVNNDKVFIPTWNNKPEEKEPILFINGIGIVTYQNMSCIIAAPGVGKSSICESICAAVIGTKDIDTLGFSVSAEVKGVLYIDNERTKTDVWNSFHRTHKRAKANEKTFIQNTIDIVGLRDVARLEERKEEIENLIKKGAYQLVIIDGAGDLVNDTNSLSEAIECRIWFRELTSKYNVSILTTLHPNKGSITPRGHIGSEIVREAESVIGVMSEGDVRTMTTDFTHGKSRNAKHVSSSFVWSEEASMFAQCDKPDKRKVKTLEPQELLSIEDINIMLKKVLGSERLSYQYFSSECKAYLKQNFLNQCKSGDNVMKTFIAYLSQNDFVKKNKVGIVVEYYLNANEEQTEISLTN
jgi:hypothetical protein